MEISQLGRTRRRGWDANPASLRNFHRGRFRATPEAKDPLTERGPYTLRLKRGRPDDWNFERNDGTRQCHSIIEHHLPRDGLDTESKPRLKINQQKRVNDYFQSTLAYWDEIYREGGVYQTIYQRRRTVALSLVDKLALPAGSRVLEVGCAHGLTTVALAERGFSVEAVDAVPEMISAARIRAQESGLAQRMSFQVADIQNLP